MQHLLTIIAWIVLMLSSLQAQTILRVSDNQHYLVTVDGRPFFWLGDTGWELFPRRYREEADYYLQRRAHQGFTVIQAVALAEFDGLAVPNPLLHSSVLSLY